MRAKILLAASIIAEVSGTISMKYASETDNSLGFVLMMALVACSYVLFTWAIKSIPLGIAYAIWEGVGLIGITVLSVFMFGDIMTPSKILGLIILLLGIRLISQGSAEDDSSEKKPGASGLATA